MSETYQEQLNRVKLMANGSSTWDLSENDRAALKAVLKRLEIFAVTELQSAPLPFGVCAHCGCALTLIRGRAPGDESRKVCPTCNTERLDRIHDISSRTHAYTDKAKPIEEIKV